MLSKLHGGTQRRHGGAQRRHEGYTENTRRFTEGRGKVNLMLGFNSVVLCEILSDALCKK